MAYASTRQRLVITAGCGRVQSWGGPIQELRPATAWAANRYGNIPFSASLRKIALANADRTEKLETGTPIDQLQNLQRRALALLDAAERGGSFAERARALRECRENVIGLGRLTGAIGAGANVVVDARSVTVGPSVCEKLDMLSIEQLAALAEGEDPLSALEAP